MMIHRPNFQKSMHQGSKFCFVVHLLKVSELPSPAPTLEEESLRKTAEKNLLKVTALYGSKQIPLGDFPILKNECVIDQHVICLLNLSKAGCHSKLHFYIDQACSSGLTGHMAFDLKEFVQEGDLELHLKYPLYASTSGRNRGPILKMTIKSMDKGAFEAFSDEENDGLILKHSEDNNKMKSPESGCALTDSVSGQCERVIFKEKLRSQYLDEARLLKLEGALNDLNEKFKILSSACKNAGSYRKSDSLSGAVQPQHAMSSAWRSSYHNGTCTNSHSETCEKLCTDSEDALDSFPDSDSMMYPPSSSKHSRAFSDVSWLGCPPVHGHKWNNSTDELSSDFLCSQSSSMGDEEDEHPVCSHECIVCSTDSLRLYEGIRSGLSRDNAISLSQRPDNQNTSVSTSTGEPSQSENHFYEIKKSASQKRPGLLKSVVGAVVFAGVSLLGVRNASKLKQEITESSGRAKNGLSATSDYPVDLRRTGSMRRHYSARFSL